ncbi:MAG: type II toxin-antitoxin system VapC family toxin [Saprospiraceae bacterium]
MATKKVILCDTNIFIDYFHGDERIARELDFLGFGRLAVSVVSVAEIYFGMRKREAAKTKELLRKFNVLHLDKEVSMLFIQFMLGYHERGIAVPDALIAASTVRNNVELFTLNRSDFEFIEGLKLYNPKF